MKRLLVVLVVLGLLLAVADEAARRVAQAALAKQARTSASLSSDPSVRIGGWPFLLQAVRGEYDEATVTAEGFRHGGARISRLQLVVHGARVPLGEALHGQVSAVPVRSLSATAVVSSLELASRSRVLGLRVEPVGDQLEVSGQLRVLGQSVRASARSDVSLRGSSVLVRARSVTVLGQSTPALVDALAGALDLVVPIGALPYGLHLTGVRVAPTGVELTASSGPTVLRAS